MFRRVPAFIGYCASLILVVLSTIMFARSNWEKQSSPSSTNSPAAQAEPKVITVWKVGDPWLGDTPDTAVPPVLDLAGRHLGCAIKIQSFPPRGFASVFFRAFEANRPPDVLAFDNDLIRSGAATPHGLFQGIASVPEIHAALEQIGNSIPNAQRQIPDPLTTPMEQPGGPLRSLQDRGWEYLIRTSPNYQAARELSMQTEPCTADSDATVLPTTIREVALRAAAAYLQNSPSLKDYEDSDRLRTEARRPKGRHVKTIRACGYWGVGDLAFVPTTASYSSESGDGQVDALIVLRRRRSEWRMLTGSTDPVSNSAFVEELPFMASLIAKPSMSQGPLDAPTLLTPGEGILTPAPGVRFADFSWHPSPSQGEVAEIVEFAYNGNARLFTIFFSGSPPETEHLSSGALWSVGNTWLWRVWSISESGAVVFSSARSFDY
jgi:hypothetical protein